MRVNCSSQTLHGGYQRSPDVQVRSEGVAGLSDGGPDDCAVVVVGGSEVEDVPPVDVVELRGPHVVPRPVGPGLAGEDPGPEAPGHQVGGEVDGEGVRVGQPTAVVGRHHRHPARPVRQPGDARVRGVGGDDGVGVVLHTPPFLSGGERPGGLVNMILTTICHLGPHHQVLLHVHD